MSSHARPLAEALAARSDDEVAELFARREVRPDAPWEDFFDAAEALLETASITRLLPRLSAEEAYALVEAAAGRDAGAARAGLEAAGLLRADGSPFPSVSAALGERGAPRVPAADDAPAEADAPASAGAAERAFTTTAVLADLLVLAQESPFGLLAGGQVGAIEKRRAVDHGLPDDSALLDDLFALGTAAGLLRPVDRQLRMTTRGEQWLALTGPERWAALAEGLRSSLPRSLRTDDGGWAAYDQWPLAHPWDPSWDQTATDLLRRAALLGLHVSGAETPWGTSLRQGRPADRDALSAHLPAEVDRIFLQNDLTAIAPGPLLPALDLRLRTFAVRESAAQASSYRFTADAVAAALASGETEEGILGFLESLSLTGVPQPLRYLISQAAQRHGLIRVGSHPESGRTLVTSSDPHLLEAIAVDQALRPLGLVAEDGALLTRVGRDAVFWALIDEHYPASLIGPDGRDERASRPGTVEAAPEAEEPRARYAGLLARLRAAQGPDADAAWLDRELEHAVRHREVLAVEVAMPDGSTRELVLEVTGLGGGRLRGRDRTADVERTLPVRSIRSTRVVESGTA
ncbi:hypothetical protein G3H63_03565 [Microbacterium resistens]|uniref:helicase-associated domain-containing protein n=1 Tax=Microbacterium resistens TaxID=156977 RepID=UPI001C573D76|nr:helicase-associated domain-containing protein [Microbacterium resistens]MBW1638160.1 hypothetical protein [Microbacterium resistens]